MLHVKRRERGLSSDPLLLKRVGIRRLKNPLLGVGLGCELACPATGTKCCMTAGGGLRVP